jgi:hypothetical protein
VRLAAGLLLVSGAPLIIQKYGLPASVKGLTGLGLRIELLPAFMAIRNEKMDRLSSKQGGAHSLCFIESIIS